MSNGRQVGSIVGSLVAAYFTAGTSYAAFAVAAGGAVGGAIGGALDPDKVVGPRLDDLKVQYSNYGVGIPTLYGTERIAPNVIWSTDKIEVSTTEHTSGKGGGGGIDNTTYKYYVNMRMLLCETPRDGSTVGIVKILQDGKLIWDASTGIPVGSALASAENPAASFILYQGHQDQLPNPEEESFHGGPGSVSAYRGVVSIYMRQIECPGGRVPQFSFVCSTSTTKSNYIYNLESFTVPSQFVAASRINISAPTLLFAGQSSGGSNTNIYAVGLDYGALTKTVVANPYWAQISVSGDADIDAACMRVNFPDTAHGTDNDFVDANGFIIKTITVGADCLADGRVYSSWSKRGDYMLIASSYPSDQVKLFQWSNGSLLAQAGIAGQQKAICTESLAWIFDGASIQVRTLDSNFTFLASAAIPSLIGGGQVHVCYGANDTLSLWIGRNNAAALWTVSYSGAAVVFTQSASLTRDDNSIPYPLQDPIRVDGKTMYCWDSQLSGGSADINLSMITFEQLTVNLTKASDIIADQCERDGETRYDVSALPDSDTVHGYKIAGAASARANIDPILTAFGYFPVDEDGAIKFKRYADIVSVATVTFDELGQAENGSEAADAMPLQRKQEIDLPRSVTVSYIEPTKDYQTASETEIRQVTDATEDMQVQLPVCLGSSDQAKKVSQMVLYDAWRRQNQRAATVSRKFAFVSPGDGVTIEYPRGTFKLWLVLSVNDTGALCEWSVVSGDAAIFTQTAVGATGYEGQQVAPLAAPTRAQILDMAILRDSDNNAGPYVALDSVAPVPADAELFVGDDDTSLQSRGTVSASAPLGFAETVLGAWTRNLVDETNTFTVSLGDDVFNSCTRDVLLANGGEFWAYGAPGRWEIGASAQGDSLGGGRYILSRHLRGMFGTENNTGNHQAGDTFVLLRIAGMLRPDTGVGGIGQTKSYRAVTKGRSTNSVPSQTYANTGEGLQPLRPVNLRRATNASNDITLSCDRRSRLSMNNSTGALPLGEAAESYTWDFYSSGAFTTRVGSLISTTSILTISSAQQTAFGLTPGAAVNVRVHQVSDAVGPSTNYLEATV